MKAKFLTVVENRGKTRINCAVGMELDISIGTRDQYELDVHI